MAGGVLRLYAWHAGANSKAAGGDYLPYF